MPSDSFYPPAPSAKLPVIRLDLGYRLRVLAVIAGLLLFLLLYLVFIVLAGIIAYGLLVLPVPWESLAHAGGWVLGFFIALKYGGALAAALLWLFLFKGLFKRHKAPRAAHVALAEEDHPELFAFIRCVYRDVGARRPRRVYVSPEVNAAMIYNTSLVNLILPPRKDLLIGLGLVNVVNLVEFKAALAHEFGHFAQRSLGLGTYLAVANRIMHDIIYSRDALDSVVDRLCRDEEGRGFFPAWGLKGLLWVVRKILAGMYVGLNTLYLSLGRQMEYNADNAAVRLTGSDALIHGLARMKFATECMAEAIQSLDAAADHGFFSDDLFYHQTAAACRLRHRAKDERLGLPPELPPDTTVQVHVFPPVTAGPADRCSSHPADYLREQNAKRVYVRSPIDDRSAWLLFGNPAALKTTVTGELYRQILRRKEPYQPRPAAEVQRVIDAEHAESTFDPRYQQFYDDRFISPGDLSVLPEPWPWDKAAAWLATWPPADLQRRVEAHQELQAEHQLLESLKSGRVSPKDKTFPFRGQQYAAADLPRLFAMVDEELHASFKSRVALDGEVFLAHWSVARHLDRAAKTDDDPYELAGSPESGHEGELLMRYRFHLSVQGLLRRTMAARQCLQDIVLAVARDPDLPADDFAQVSNPLNSVLHFLAETLETARSMQTPALLNVPAGTPLHALIVDRANRTLSPRSRHRITQEWVTKLAARLEAVLTRLKRVHFKNLGGLLACQERLAEQVKRA